MENTFLQIFFYKSIKFFKIILGDTKVSLSSLIFKNILYSPNKKYD